MLFALAKYVTKKLGNLYPYLPIVESPEGKPVKSPTGNSLGLDYVAELYSENGSVYLNSTDSDLDEASEDCISSSVNNDGGIVVLDGFTRDSEYPEGYSTQKKAWIETLEALDSRETSTELGASGRECDTPYNIPSVLTNRSKSRANRFSDLYRSGRES
jgi:hypothetical protein